MENNYTAYCNGPFVPLWNFILQIINPFNWGKISWGWVRWSIKQNMPRRFKYPKQEFDYMMQKYFKRIEWFKEYGYIKK